LVPFLLVAILAALALHIAVAAKMDHTPTVPTAPAPITEIGVYNPPIPQPEIEYSFESARQMVAAGMPILVSFLWSDGMNVLDDYGYLVVERGDLEESRDFVRVACIAYYEDAASGRNVFQCGPFYGRWQWEDGKGSGSFAEGGIRNFMITDEDMRLLFEYGAYAIR
jgi:hypothetical protein